MNRKSNFRLITSHNQKLFVVMWSDARCFWCTRFFHKDMNVLIPASLLAKCQSVSTLQPGNVETVLSKTVCYQLSSATFLLSHSVKAIWYSALSCPQTDNYLTPSWNGQQSKCTQHHYEQIYVTDYKIWFLVFFFIRSKVEGHTYCKEMDILTGNFFLECSLSHLLSSISKVEIATISFIYFSHSKNHHHPQSWELRQRHPPHSWAIFIQYHKLR